MELNRSEKIEWIKGLKVGDEVALRGSSFMSSVSIYKIEKITPTGRLNLRHGYVINKDGSIRGDMFGGIEPVTDAIRQKIWRSNTQQYVRDELNVFKLSDNDLNRIFHIIKESKKSEEN